MKIERYGQSIGLTADELRKARNEWEYNNKYDDVWNDLYSLRYEGCDDPSEREKI